MPSGPPLRCKAQGGWGGSAHWPDPTAQSAPRARFPPRPCRRVPSGPGTATAWPSRGVRHRHAIHAAPAPRRSASPSRGVRLCLAGRQALTCLRPCSASSDTPASARCALTGTPDTFARRGPSARALRPCGRNGSNAAAWHPRVLSGREGLVPRLVRMLRIRFVRPLELSRCIARLNSRARAMTFQ